MNPLTDLSNLITLRQVALRGVSRRAIAIWLIGFGNPHVAQCGPRPM